MKPGYRWSIIYVSLLVVAFFATVESSSAFTLLANSVVDEIAVSHAVITNTVSSPEKFSVSTVASMNQDREGHLAILLADGKVLIVGGRDFGTEYTSSEVYNPVTNAWTLSGDLNVARSDNSSLHRATLTLLDSGKVLIVGGASSSPLSAEVYDPATGVWTLTDPLNSEHKIHTATLLADGRVLVVGGDSNVAEIYDPSDGSWSVTGSTNQIRYNHAAVLLSDGKVLVTGGDDGYLPVPTGTKYATSEVYDVVNGLWSNVQSMNTPRSGHMSLLLSDGKVLVAGLDTSSELYTPTADAWTNLGSRDQATTAMPSLYTTSDNQAVLFAYINYWLYDHVAQTWSPQQTLENITNRYGFAITPLSPTQYLLSGGFETVNTTVATPKAAIAKLLPANQFTASLTVPNGWITAPSMVSFVATSTGAPVDAVGLSNADVEPSTWITVTPGAEASTLWNFGSDSVNKNVYLFVRDSNGNVAKVVTAAVKVDQTLPSSWMTKPSPNANGTVPQWPYSPATFPVTWQGNDATSGIAGYDLEVKTSAMDWTRVLTNTTLLAIDYTGVNEESYYFRVRARDVAGNVEAWLEPYDGMTQVDDEAPVGNIKVATVGATSTLLLIDAMDNLSGVTQMRVALADDFDDAAWENYATTKTISFGGPSPRAFIVYIQFRDAVGNISTVQCASYGPPACYRLTFPMIRLRSNQ